MQRAMTSGPDESRQPTGARLPRPAASAVLLRILAWSLPLMTTGITVAFFYLLSTRSPLLARAIGSGRLAVAVLVALLSIALSMTVILAYGLVAAYNERKLAAAQKSPGLQ